MHVRCSSNWPRYGLRYEFELETITVGIDEAASSERQKHAKPKLAQFDQMKAKAGEGMVGVGARERGVMARCFFLAVQDSSIGDIVSH